jgi:hypothetical protein
MFFRHYLLGLLIFNVSSLVAQDVFAQEISKNEINREINQSPAEVAEIEKIDSSVKKCVSCDNYFDIKKCGKALLRGTVFFAEAFIAYKVINYFHNKYYERDLYVDFNEALLYCLVWELAGQAEGFPSLFREKDKNVCVK